MVKVSGFSLVETMIALFVSTIGILGVGVLQLQTIKTTSDAGQRSSATWLTQEIVERMRINVAGTRANAYAGTVSCGAQPAKICASHHNGTTRVAADVCNASEMATYELWDLACGLASADNQYRGSNDFMTGLSFELQCQDADTTDVDACSEDSPVTLALSWDERGAKPDAGEVAKTTDITLEVRL